VSDIILKVGGKSYTGWAGISLSMGIDQVSGVFSLSIADKLSQWNIRMGDECIVELAGEKLLTGYVEDMPIDYDATKHSASIMGRDKAGDLVDCSFDGSASELRNQSVRNIISTLCEPYGISLVVDSSVTEQANFKIDESFTIDPGEEVFGIIGRLCRMKGILPISYGDGNLTLTRAATGRRATDTLELGVNVLNGRIEQSDRERFSRYIVIGTDVGRDSLTPEEIAGPSGEATDEVISRFRPMIINAETKMNAKVARERAHWEARLRAGRSRTIEYTLQGWTQSDGKPWPLNSLVRVKDSFLQIDDTLLIYRVGFLLNEEGTLTRLGVTNREAFELIEEPVTKISSKFDIRDLWETAPPKPGG